jgi:hypothetical protein
MSEWRKPALIVAIVLAAAIALAFLMPTHGGHYGYP